MYRLQEVMILWRDFLGRLFAVGLVTSKSYNRIDLSLLLLLLLMLLLLLLQQQQQQSNIFINLQDN